MPLSQEDQRKEEKIKKNIDEKVEFGGQEYININLFKKIAQMVKRLERLEENAPTQPISGEVAPGNHRGLAFRPDAVGTAAGPHESVVALHTRVKEFMDHVKLQIGRLELAVYDKSAPGSEPAASAAPAGVGRLGPTQLDAQEKGKERQLEDGRRERERANKIEELEKKIIEISNRKTQCDTHFRQKYKRVIEKYFHIREYGEQIVCVRDRETGAVLARKIQGVVYGDGGPYIECNEEDIVKASFVEKENRVFFNLWHTADKTVSAYFQKKDVVGQPNAPKQAKYRDPRNRIKGYAKYKVGKFYFAPDEIDISIGLETYPGMPRTLSEMLDQDSEILSLEEKEKAKSLIFCNCTKEEQELVADMSEKKMSEFEIEITRTQRIGKEREQNKPKPLLCVFRSVTQCEQIYANRHKLGASRIFSKKISLLKEGKSNRKREKIRGRR